MSQLCESFSLERRVSEKRNTKDKRLWCIMLHKKFTYWYETIPSRHKEWNSMKNLALLAVFTIASIPSRIIQALSVLEFESVWIENIVPLISRRHSVKVLMSKGRQQPWQHLFWRWTVMSLPLDMWQKQVNDHLWRCHLCNLVRDNILHNLKSRTKYLCVLLLQQHDFVVKHMSC